MTREQRINTLKKRVKRYFFFNHKELEQWWHTRAALFHGKSPHEMTENQHDMKRLELLVKMSTPEKVGRMAKS